MPVVKRLGDYFRSYLLKINSLVSLFMLSKIPIFSSKNKRTHFKQCPTFPFQNNKKNQGFLRYTYVNPPLQLPFLFRGFLELILLLKVNNLTVDHEKHQNLQHGKFTHIWRTTKRKKIKFTLAISLSQIWECVIHNRRKPTQTSSNGVASYMPGRQRMLSLFENQVKTNVNVKYWSHT